MGRGRRIDFEHAYHHVMSRGTAQWNIFLDDCDRNDFLALLARVHRKYAMSVLAYCLMGNHVHLVLYCPYGNLAQAMRDLKSMYALGFNRRHRRSGPLFESRYVNKVITDDPYLTAAIRYVHRNPLDLGSTIDLADYPWSSHGVYLGLRMAPPWLDVDLGRQLIGPDYRRTVEEPRPDDKVQNRAGSGQAKSAVPGTALLATRSDEVSLSEIIVAVADAAGCSPSSVQPRARNGLVGIAVVLAMDVAKQTSTEIAQPLGFKSAGAVRRQASVTRKRLREDQAAATLFTEAKRILGA